MWAVICFSLFFVVSGQYEPNWDSIDKRPLPSWYDEAKFGIFLHWGVFSVPSFGSEWFWWNWQGAKSPPYIEFMEKNYPPGFTYPDFAPMFKAELYDPDEWADLFKAAGAKYVVLTSKHHEGWTNWPSSVAWNWNAMDSGPHRDILGDLANSIRNRTDIKFGLYHSLFEWFNPLYLEDKANGFKTNNYVVDVALVQLKEIINGYKPEVLWSDGDWEAPDTYWNSTGFLAWLYNESPVKDMVVTNDRWGKGDACHHGGYYTCDDRYNPGKLQTHKWENAMTIDRSSWGYRREAVLANYLNINELLYQLVSTVSCGGNLLVNVGPTHDGRIMPVFEERLTDMGKWLEVNGEAIYNTTPWRVQNDSSSHSVWYTQSKMSPHIVYAIVLDWPQEGQLQLMAPKTSSGSSVSMLGYGKKLDWSPNSQGAGLTVMMNDIPLMELPSEWAWVIALQSVE
jgi:alpha-L-fucosidase